MTRIDTTGLFGSDDKGAADHFVPLIGVETSGTVFTDVRSWSVSFPAHMLDGSARVLPFVHQSCILH